MRPRSRTTTRSTWITVESRWAMINVDRVVVLDRGRIVETGRHDELVKSSAVYRQLIDTQLSVS